MQKSIAKKSLLVILSLILIMSTFLFGCDDTISNDKIATTLEINTINYEDGSPCYYVEVQIISDDAEITLNKEDFTYSQDNSTKTASGFILQIRESGSISDGITTSKKYASKIGDSFHIEPNYVASIQIIVETNSQISSMMYKGNKITRNKMFY